MCVLFILETLQAGAVKGLMQNHSGVVLGFVSLFPHLLGPSRSLSLAGTATSIIFVATKQVFCCDRNFVPTNIILSPQKMLVATKDKVNFSRQNYVCRDKSLSREAYVCRDKRRLLSRQKYLWQLPPAKSPPVPLRRQVGVKHV